jgi:hypothetical protein
VVAALFQQADGDFSIHDAVFGKQNSSWDELLATVWDEAVGGTFVGPCSA